MNQSDWWYNSGHNRKRINAQPSLSYPYGQPGICDSYNWGCVCSSKTKRAIIGFTYGQTVCVAVVRKASASFFWVFICSAMLCIRSILIIHVSSVLLGDMKEAALKLTRTGKRLMLAVAETGILKYLHLIVLIFIIGVATYILKGFFVNLSC